MMMNHPARTLTVLALATVALLACLLLIAPFPILDTQPGLSAGEVYRILGELTDAQRARYRVMLAVDFLFPLAYAGFLVVALRTLASRTSGLLWFRRIGVVAAIAAAVFDYVENTLIFIILRSLPDTVFAAEAVGRITMLKWSTLGIASGMLLVAGIVSLAQRRTRRQEMEAINIIGRGVTDPHIKVYGDRAYLYASHDYARDNEAFDMRDWQVWSSADLHNWKLESVLRPEDTYIGRPFRGCWATDAVEKNGRYYWVFSEVDTDANRHQIGMVVGETPTGPWKDELAGPLLADGAADTRVYDPCLFTDHDGTVYLLFGVWDYFIVALADDMRSPVGKPRRLEVVNPEGPYGKGKTDDKVFLHVYDGTYYLSWGAYYATSESLDGPYTYRGCFVDPARMEARFRERTWPHGPTQGRHGSFFVWKNQWYFAYCEMCFSGNRYYRDFWISRVYYAPDGSIEPIVIDSTAGAS